MRKIELVAFAGPKGESVREVAEWIRRALGQSNESFRELAGAVYGRERDGVKLVGLEGKLAEVQQNLLALEGAVIALEARVTAAGW